MNYNHFFDRTGTPCTDADIQKMEAELGYSFPADYTQMLKETGGGFLAPETTVIEGDFSKFMWGEGLVIDVIYGKGELTSKRSNNLVKEARWHWDEWEVDHRVLPIATTAQGMHDCIAINYALPAMVEGSIVYLNSDHPDEPVLLAPSFKLLMTSLVEDEEAVEEGDTLDAAEQRSLTAKAKSVACSLHEPFNPIVQRVLALTTEPAIDRILRAAELQLFSQDDSTIWLNFSEPGKAYLDLTFWLSSLEGEVQSFEDFLRRPAPGTEFYGATSPANFMTLTPFTLGRDGWRPNITYMDIILTSWWDDRTTNGIIVDTGTGLILDQAHFHDLKDSLLAYLDSNESTQEAWSQQILKQ
ncbi:SMI1/KNR4 family protein [Corynebacterium sp. H127]|uniref:SMI1/KNR4 family protein n=1 Tax=Corynebacterium sp. H127 TaxID=3133418 RepID=UPI0030A14D52